MIRNLAPCAITERSIFQTETNYRTAETVIIANGRPIMAATTKQEAEDMIAYLNGRKPRRAATPPNVTMPSDTELWGV
jgi:hypothetical protein